MYHGEVNVAQEELNSFLAVAEELKVKGLTQNQSNANEANQTRSKSPTRIKPRMSEIPAAPPKRPKPPPQTTSFSSANQQNQRFSQIDDDDIQELPTVKTEPREYPAPTPPVPLDQPTPSTETDMNHQQLVHQDQYTDETGLVDFEDYGQYGDSSYDENQYSQQMTADGGKGE